MMQQTLYMDNYAYLSSKSRQIGDCCGSSMYPKEHNPGVLHSITKNPSEEYKQVSPTGSIDYVDLENGDFLRLDYAQVSPPPEFAEARHAVVNYAFIKHIGQTHKTPLNLDWLRWIKIYSAGAAQYHTDLKCFSDRYLASPTGKGLDGFVISGIVNGMPSIQQLWWEHVRDRVQDRIVYEGPEFRNMNYNKHWPRLKIVILRGATE